VFSSFNLSALLQYDPDASLLTVITHTVTFVTILATALKASKIDHKLIW